jgi:small subunit ribosomal protein S16
MAVKIRLRQQGRTNRKMYRLVAAEDRSPRDGKHLEVIGWYNPHEQAQEKHLHINVEKVQYWLSVGAILTPKAKALIKKAAPNIIKELNERKQKAKEKRAKKRRERRKKVKESTSKKKSPEAQAKKTKGTKETAPKKRARAPRTKKEKIEAK